jgi:hypothetical protein
MFCSDGDDRPSCISKRDQRIGTPGATSGNVGCQTSDEKEAARNADNRRWATDGGMKEHGLHQATG